MLHTQLDGLIADAMKAGRKPELETLKLIKCEFVKAQKDGTVLDDLAEARILLKMASQRKDAIGQFLDGDRPDLAEAEKVELGIIERFLPEQATDEDIANYTLGVITAYTNTHGPVSMRDMKPILTLVQEKYPTANGKIVSKTLQTFLKS